MSPTSTSSSLFILSSLALSAATAVAEQRWHPSLKPRNVDHLVKPRAPRTGPLKSRLAKRQSSQNPGQPVKVAPADKIGGFEEIGTTGVSAQMLFLGTENKVYILDKVENNALQVNGHPAWATEYDLLTNTVRPMDVVTNTFCAGGTYLGDGRMLNVGGNQGVIPGGNALTNSTPNVYQDQDGAFATRLLMPGDNSEWDDSPDDDLTTRRWYPTLEPLDDGRAIIIGGNLWGGFVNSPDNNNPTYEYYPRAPGATPLPMSLLERTLPANLFPITHLLPTGQLLLNLNNNATIYDHVANQEYLLPNVPKAVRTYPASAANFMWPLTVESKWLATVMYCGGSDLQPNQWASGIPLVNVPGSDSCVKITPEISNEWEDDDSLPEGRVMGNAIILPDSKVFVANGANTGCAGYGTESWVVEDSYADNPVYSPILFDFTKPAGQRWSRDGLKDSPIPRMYHSTATLLPDGSVFIAGSNPHPDLNLNSKFPTEYRAERFYPFYYNKRRPEPKGLPTSLSYGGKYFDIQLSSDDLSGNQGNLKATKVVVIKTGFSTHAINFGQRYAELDFTYTANKDGGATLHVSQLPPNAAIFAPGPCWMFVTIDGVPSVGVPVMAGSGKIETQSLLDVEALPESSEVTQSADDGNNSNRSSKNAAATGASVRTTGVVLAVLAASMALFA